MYGLNAQDRGSPAVFTKAQGFACNCSIDRDHSISGDEALPFPDRQCDHDLYTLSKSRSPLILPTSLTY